MGKVKDSENKYIDGMLMIAFKDGEESNGYKSVKKHEYEQGDVNGVAYETQAVDNSDGVALVDLYAEVDDYVEFSKALFEKWGILDDVADFQFEPIEKGEEEEISDSKKIKDNMESVNKLYSINVSYWDDDHWYDWTVLNESVNPNYSEIEGIYIDEQSAMKAFDDFVAKYNDDEFVADVTLYESTDMSDEWNDLVEYFKSIDESIDEHIENGLLDKNYYDELDGSYLLYNDLKSETIEPKHHNDDINEDAIIIEWEWQKYVGYARKFKRIGRAWEFGIKTKFDLTTGNSERVFRSNLSDFPSDITSEELLDEVSDWKWTNQGQLERDVYELLGDNE